jgi:hypothetical protein
MAHFAKVNNGIVTQVIVAEPEFFDTFIDSSPGDWIQTSYNTKGGVHYEPNLNTPSEDQSKALRKNFAGIGFTYDAQRDAFIPPKPYPSWLLNEDTCFWYPPTPMPEDVGTGSPPKRYAWDEITTSWVDVTPTE